MFYRIRNHLFNLNEVINIRIADEFIKVNTKDNREYTIPCYDINVNALMDKIQKDLTAKGVHYIEKEN